MSKSNKKFVKVSKTVQKEKKSTIKGVEKELKRTYTDVAIFIENELKNKDENNFSETDLILLQKQLNKSFKEQTKEIKKIIELAVIKIVEKTLDANLEVYKGIDKKLGTKLYDFFKDKYKDIKDKVVNAVIKGEMYKDKHGLSDRIWKDLKKNQSAIDAIIKQGIKNKDHPLDIAKKLEKYVNPDKMKGFNWSVVYPGSKTKIEYNALRLARTSINHAHHQAVINAAKKNPLVTHIEWLSAGAHGRTCEMCSNRDGQIYKIDRVPEDHPNGMCMLLEVIPEDDILEKIFDDFLDSEYEDLDEFMESYR